MKIGRAIHAVLRVLIGHVFHPAPRHDHAARLSPRELTPGPRPIPPGVADAMAPAAAGGPCAVPNPAAEATAGPAASGGPASNDPADRQPDGEDGEQFAHLLLDITIPADAPAGLVVYRGRDGRPPVGWTRSGGEAAVTRRRDTPPLETAAFGDEPVIRNAITDPADLPFPALVDLATLPCSVLMLPRITPDATLVLVRPAGARFSLDDALSLAARHGGLVPVPAARDASPSATADDAPLGAGGSSFGLARRTVDLVMSRFDATGVALYLPDPPRLADAAAPDPGRGSRLMLAAMSGACAALLPSRNAGDAPSRLTRTETGGVRLTEPFASTAPRRRHLAGTTVLEAPIPLGDEPDDGVLIVCLADGQPGDLAALGEIATAAGERLRTARAADRRAAAQRQVSMGLVRQELALTAIGRMLAARSLRDGLVAFRDALVPAFTDMLLLYLIDPPPTELPDAVDLGPAMRVLTAIGGHERGVETAAICQVIDRYAAIVLAPTGDALKPEQVGFAFPPLLADERPLAPEYRETLPTTVRSGLGVALLRDGAVTGLLVVVNDRSGRRRALGDLDSLRALGPVLAEAIQRQAGPSALPEKSRAAAPAIASDGREVLTSLAVALATATTIPEVYAAVARHVTVSLADWCLIDEVQRHGVARLLAVHSDAERTPPASIWRDISADPPGCHGAAMALRTGQADFVPSMHGWQFPYLHDTSPLATAVRDMRTVAHMSVPVHQPPDTIRAIVTAVITDPSRELTLDALDLLERIGSLAAAALRRLAGAEPAPAPRTLDEIMAEIFADAAFGVALIDTDGRYIFSNIALNRLLGLETSAVSTDDVLQNVQVLAMNGEILNRSHLPSARAIDSGTLIQTSVLLRRYRGRQLIARLTAVPLADAQRRRAGALLFVENDAASHRERVQVRARLDTALRELTRSLAATEGWLQVLEQRPAVDTPDGEQSATLARLQAVRRGLDHGFAQIELLHETLATAFPEQTLLPRLLELGLFIEGCIERFLRHHSDYPITFAWRAGSPMEMVADPIGLESILDAMFTGMSGGALGTEITVSLTYHAEDDSVIVTATNPFWDVSDADLAGMSHSAAPFASDAAGPEEEVVVHLRMARDAAALHGDLAMRRPDTGGRAVSLRMPRSPDRPIGVPRAAQPFLDA